MKKFSFLFLLGIFLISGFVKAGGMPEYIITDGNVKYFKKLRFNISANLVGIDESGKMRYNIDEITAYSKDGHIYERVPVICNGKETGTSELMELLAYRNGLKVYRRDVFTGCNNSRADEYIVFNNGKYHVCFNEKNCETLTRFFFKG